MDDFSVCASRNPDNTCKKLKALCTADECPFRRTEEEAAADREKTDARLRSLGEAGQRYISEKYYGGARPWKNGGVKR